MDEDTNAADVAPPIEAPGLPSAGTQSSALVPAPKAASLSVAQHGSKPKAMGWRWPQVALALTVAAGVAGGAFYVWRQSQSQLPPGIASGNGRIEALEIDIDTKFAGRIYEMRADEGDMVKTGQVLARMDTRDLEASLRKYESQVQQAQQNLDEARANVVQQTTQVTLAQQEFDRTNALVGRGFATNELLDQRRQALNGAIAALNAAKDRISEADRAIDAATHEAELYKVNIADNTLVAPREGRLQYRIAEIGEVLPAGGRVFSMLDIAYVYMDIYLPTDAAGKVKIGGDARIVLDAVPNVPIPAKVLFVANQAQFTPKTVETKDERDKLMFRVRVKIDPERLRSRGALVRSGLPGVGYVKFNPAVDWPPNMQGTDTK
jgi:HlyD family secretion protein